MCLCADGRYALSGSGDNTLRLWEVATGGCVHTFTGHQDWVSSVWLSADGRYALSGSADKALRFWFLDWELQDKQPADWDEGARPYLHTFIRLHTPSSGLFPRRAAASWSGRTSPGCCTRWGVPGTGGCGRKGCAASWPSSPRPCKGKGR